jgi:lysine biosynthesis protein LysW
VDCDTNENADIGDTIICPNCKCSLEIIDLAPVILDYAVDEDEDEVS